MPSSKYTPRPGPFPSPEKPGEFSFDAEQWQDLPLRLPERLRQLSAPPEVGSSNWSIADLIVQVTAEQIGAYFVTMKVMQAKGVTPLTPASERPVIREVRRAIKPILKGYVTEETAAIISWD